MRIKTNKNILNIVLVCMVLFGTADKLSAINPVRIDTAKAQLVIPRPALESVPTPLVRSASDPIDTLDTVNEFIKVILYADNTWQYYKTPDYQKVTGVFENDWKENVTNPYGVKQEDLPASWSIWLVDSLDQYHCPFIGDIHPRGKFGPRRGRRHQGVDLPLKTGDPIYAAFTGKVRFAKYMSGFGNLIIIRHENGIETFYAHLSKMHVKVGDWVNAGDVIGLGGSTGRSTGPHLHFETRFLGQAINPALLFDFEKQDIVADSYMFKKGNNRYRRTNTTAYASNGDIQYYKVRKGDSLSRIAQKTGTSIDALCKLNKISRRTTLRIGQVLRCS
mgnify:CR=1 FL=1